jgi:hypothetical protein
MISGFSCEVDENSALLGYYAASNSNSLPTFRDRQIVPNRRQGITTTRCVIAQKSEVLRRIFLT